MSETVEKRPTGAEDIVWDLSVFYDGLDDPKIEADFERIRTLAQDFSKLYRGKIASLSAAEMLAACQMRDKIYDLGGRVETYASLNFTTFSTDPKWGAFIQKTQELDAEIGQELVFFGLEWNAVDDETAQKLLSDPVLAPYRYHLASDRRYKPYQLSEAEEKVIIGKDVTGRNAFTRLFDQIMAAQEYEFDGEMLPQPQILSKLKEGDREERRKAAAALTKGLREKTMELTFVFNVLAADKATEDKLRGFPTWISSRNLANKAPDDVVEALIEAVTSSYELVARHYNIKRALLGYDELYDYDRYAPLNLKESDAFYTWDQARDIVLKAFERFSPTMAMVASKFFEENWIHAPVMSGKRGGAYAHPSVLSAHPFVFTNFTGNSSSVMTLAHELGHGIHMYLSGQDNEVLENLYTPLTTAEMASVFAEMLVFQDLMAREEDEEVKLAMLAEKIEDTFATVYRQVSMNRFEDGMHTSRRTEGELSSERLSEIWMKTQKEMFQGSVTMTDDYSIWWSYVPHFLHTPGYVYAYAFGELLVLALYNLYKKEGESFTPKYERLLSAGDSNDPDQLLAAVGVDLNDPGFWKQGVQAVKDLVDQEEALAKQLYPDRF
ncbi:M3 family oligoendopeptidase [Phototrophicus methaneseepsis]|uniref:M3 family oligoendopeptidase n=1 Tax=Phototrophicus methaneseepsis TaxID=2710758 RepID=A0A7S8EA80_9CHLR|nr:M3 family oligoendopeptidase [Phototrophicus methaneseepsis]QPC83241.1 M3 family oligoendopeptidase [Phototrophicus methaneseepsis]